MLFFRDVEQLARACSAILKQYGLERLWSPSGPTSEAYVYESEPSSAPPAARSTVRVLLALWNRRSLVTIGELFDALEPADWTLLADFLGAAAKDEAAIADWIIRTESTEAPPLLWQES